MFSIIKENPPKTSFFMNLKCGIYKSMKINLQIEIHLLFQICACSENNEFPVMLKKKLKSK